MQKTLFFCITYFYFDFFFIVGRNCIYNQKKVKLNTHTHALYTHRSAQKGAHETYETWVLLGRTGQSGMRGAKGIRMCAV